MAHINEQFYSSRPADYLRRRMVHLVITATSDERIAEIVAGGVRLGETVLQSEQPEKRYDDEDRRQRDRFVAIEAEVLLHHTAETLLRMLFAHRGWPKCPWIELAKLRMPRQFRDEVDTMVALGDSALRELVHEVFYAGIDPETFTTPPSTAEWTDSLDSIRRLLGDFGRVVNGRSDLYNTVKHGLGVQAGEHSISMTDDASGKTFLGHAGPALSFVSYDRHKDRWQESTVWIDVQGAVQRIDLGCRLLDQLWSVGQALYVDSHLPGANIFNKDYVDSVLRTRRLSINQMSWYEWPPEPDSETDR
jgi:hypothetical protein